MWSAETGYYLSSYGVVLLAAIFGATPLVKRAAGKLPPQVAAVGQPVALVVLLVVVTAYLVDGSFNPFLYFRF